MKKILLYTVRTIAVLICLMFIWRVIFAENKSTLSKLSPTDTLCAAYAENGNIELLTHDVVDEISDNGYFSAYAFVYSPETSELQVTVRYNNSTVNALGDVEFRLFTVDSSSGKDATNVSGGDAGVDENGGRTYQGHPAGDDVFPTVAEKTKKLFYNYERLVFDGIEIGENTNVIITICKAGAAKNDQTYEAAVTAHFAEQPMKNYKLSNSEKALLEGKE